MGDTLILEGLFGYKSFIKPNPVRGDGLILKESLAKMSLSSETAPVRSSRPKQKFPKFIGKMAFCFIFLTTTRARNRKHIVYGSVRNYARR